MTSLFANHSSTDQEAAERAAARPLTSYLRYPFFGVGPKRNVERGVKCLTYPPHRKLRTGILIVPLIPFFCFASACASATVNGVSHASTGAPVATTNSDVATEWAARWKVQHEEYLQSSAEVLIAYDKSDADGFYEGIKKLTVKGQDFLAAVRAAGPAPTRVAAAAKEIVIALEAEPELLGKLDLACGKTAEACTEALENWARNSNNLLRAISDVQP